MEPAPAHTRACPPGFELSIAGHIATLSITREQKSGALSTDMWAAFPGLIGTINDNPDIRAIVIRGSGSNFSAGFDISDLQELSLAEFWRVNEAAEAALAGVRLPTIAAISGACIGGGLELAVACDVRIAGQDARLGITAAKLGVVYPPGPTRRLVEVVGMSWTRYLLLTAAVIDADQAGRIGLVHTVSSDPYAHALHCAESMVELSSLSQCATKSVLAASRYREREWLQPEAASDRSVESRADLAGPRPPQWLERTYRSELAEGSRAFAGRRKARFQFSRTDWMDS